MHLLQICELIQNTKLTTHFLSFYFMKLNLQGEYVSWHKIIEIKSSVITKNKNRILSLHVDCLTTRMTLTLIRKRMLIGVFTSTTKNSVENYETRHTHTYSILVVNFKFWLCKLQKHYVKHKYNWNKNYDTRFYGINIKLFDWVDGIHLRMIHIWIQYLVPR